MTFIKHELKMNLRFLLIWSMAVGGMIFCYMLIYPMMEESMNEIGDAFSQMGAFSEAFGLGQISMKTAMGFFGVEVGAALSIGGSIYAAMVGTAMLAKEEGEHTTEFLFVTPNTRIYYVTAKLAAMVILITVFDLICILFGILGFACIGEEIVWKQYLLFFLAQYLMHLNIAGIGFGISAFLKKNNIGLGIGVAIILYFVNLFANITDKVDGFHFITPFSYADAAEIFSTEKLQTEYLISGIIIMVLAVMAAYMKYSRKDLNI